MNKLLDFPDKFEKIVEIRWKIKARMITKVIKNILRIEEITEEDWIRDHNLPKNILSMVEPYDFTLLDLDNIFNKYLPNYSFSVNDGKLVIKVK